MRAASESCSLSAALRTVALAGVLAVSSAAVEAQEARAEPLADFRGVLVRAPGASDAELARLRDSGYRAVVLHLSDDGGEAECAAAQRIAAAGFELFYWIEVARNPALADKHPEWMASLQGHPEWRRFFPEAPEAKDGEVIKCYPWVPIAYEGAYEAHLERVARLLRERPAARGVFLNDLQAAPSACGCGHPLCRWTTDYGPVRTAKGLGEDAAARFVDAVRERAGKARVIPVWATECEEHDGAEDGLCAGVGCYRGRCWREYAKQLRPVAERAPNLAVLATYKALQRDLPRYEKPAGWVRWALESFARLPPAGEEEVVEPARLVAVLQGWNTSADEVEAQRARAREAGATGTLVALAEIEQGWEPRLVAARSK
jgi:hypothetical protein